MSVQDIDGRVKNILADVLGLDVSEVDETTSKDTVEAWNSLNHLTVVMALEEEFGVQFSDDDMVALVSLPVVVSIIGEKLASA